MTKRHNQYAEHREKKRREKEYASGFYHMVPRQRVPGLKEPDDALVFQIPPDELRQRISPWNVVFDVGRELEPVRHCARMAPAKDQRRDQGEAIKDPNLDDSKKSTAVRCKK